MRHVEERLSAHENDIALGSGVPDVDFTVGVELDATAVFQRDRARAAGYGLEPLPGREIEAGPGQADYDGRGGRGSQPPAIQVRACVVRPRGGKRRFDELADVVGRVAVIQRPGDSDDVGALPGVFGSQECDAVPRIRVQPCLQLGFLPGREVRMFPSDDPPCCEIVDLICFLHGASWPDATGRRSGFGDR